MTIYSYEALPALSAFLLACFIDISGGSGSQNIAEFTSGSPARCGSIKYVNAEDVLFISDALSSEGRIDNAIHSRSQGKKYFKESEFERSTPWYKSPPPDPANRPSSFVLPSSNSEEGNSPFKKSPFNGDSPDFKDGKFNNKLTQMFPRLGNDGPSSQEANRNKEPEGFFNFMQNKFTWPYQSEMRRFPGHPSKMFGDEPKKKPVKKDLLDGVFSSKLEPAKRTTDSPSRYNRPGKYPKFVQHLLDAEEKKKQATAPTTIRPEFRERDDYARSLNMPPSRRPFSPEVPRDREANSGVMDLLASLGPEKVRQLKKLLGSEGRKDYDSPSSRVSPKDYDSLDTRYPDRDRVAESAEEHRPPIYSLDSYTNPSGSMDKARKYRSGRRFERTSAHHTDDDSSPKSSEDEHARALPETVPRRRPKRDVFPMFPFEKEAAEQGINLKGNAEGDKCTWIFKKGKACKKLVVNIQYWIDGVRDCAQEYLKISGGKREGDRLCGGHENLQPYIIEGEKLAIEHFKGSNAGPGVTKFRGTVQCHE